MAYFFFAVFLAAFFAFFAICPPKGADSDTRAPPNHLTTGSLSRYPSYQM